MTSSELLSLYTKAIQSYINSGNEVEHICKIKVMTACYIGMFNEVPNFISTDFDACYLGKEVKQGEAINYVKTMQNLQELFKDQCIVLRSFEHKVLIADHLIITSDEDCICGCYKYDVFPDEILNCIVTEISEDIRYMGYVTNGSNGFQTMQLEVNKTDCDIQNNYNSDLPYTQIVDFINGEESGIIVLHGCPGTGNFSKIFCILCNIFYKNKLPFSSEMG